MGLVANPNESSRNTGLWMMTVTTHFHYHVHVVWFKEIWFLKTIYVSPLFSHIAF